ncbi:MAG: hypothetical protein NWR72_06355 [Bacteroidia bacterium]|nr:hypothetical protein [Bacteroidia bacterium]
MEADTPAPVVQRKKPKASGLRVGDNLSAFAQIVEELKPEQDDNKAEEEQVSYSLNEAIHIPKEKFDKALAGLIEQLQGENKMNLASAIKEGKTELLHNRWSLAVANEVLFQIVEREKDLLPYLRDQLEVSELFLALTVDSSGANDTSARPYTEEQKLKVMTEENPALKRLQEIFKTRIIY